MSSTRTATGSSLRKSSSFPAAEVAASAGAAPIGRRCISGSGYGTNTAKWSVGLDDGRRVFVKRALDDVAAGWLRDEVRVYASVSESFLPRFVGWYDAAGETLLVIEDLGDAYWPPPWSSEQISAVLATLDSLHGTAPPPVLPPLEAARDRLDGWPAVAADPEPLLSTRLCSPKWLEAALPVLEAASAACVLSGGALLHLDVRSDNLCFRGEQVLLVDWNLACVGNPLIDAVAWLPSLRLEGGPEPWELVPDSGGLAALLAGFFASRAGLPPPQTAPTVRDFQRRQAEVALPWAARELGLSPPTLRP
jgi:Phosphotransferase enzyme family